MPPCPVNFCIFRRDRVSPQAGLKLLTSGDLPASASRSVGTTGMSHQCWDHVCVCVLIGSHSVTQDVIMAQCSLEPLGSSDPLASASCIAGTTGVHYHIWLIFKFFVETRSHFVTLSGLEMPITRQKLREASFLATNSV